MSLRFCGCCLLLLLCTVMLIGCGGAQGHRVSVVQYGIKTLEVPDIAPTSYTYRVGNSGDTTGYVYCVGPVIWDSNGKMTRLADPPEGQISNTDAMDTICINDSGTMAGAGIVQSGGNRIRSVIVWDSADHAKVLADTNNPDIANLQVCALTDTGRVICVETRKSDYEFSLVIFEPDGTVTDGTPPGDISTLGIMAGNNYGLLVGQMLVDSKWQAVAIDTAKKTLKVLPLLSGATSSSAASVNNQGIIVGSCTLEGGASTWVIWDGLGNIHDLGLPPGFTSGTTSSINDNGWVVGGAAKTGGDSAFIRMPDGRWINLGLFDGIAASHPYTINNLGLVSGITYPTNPTGGRMTRAVVWTPIGGV